jgi:hypothetical protein
MLENDVGADFICHFELDSAKAVLDSASCSRTASTVNREIIRGQDSICATGFSGSLLVNSGQSGNKLYRRHARNRSPLAPSGIPFVFEIDLQSQEASWEETNLERSSGVDLPDGRREPDQGAARIHGELITVGFDLSERTISRWMKRAPRDPEPAKCWLTFLRNHREAIAAMDFFTVPTLT